MGITKELAAFVAETPSQHIPTEAIQAAKPLVLDTLGISLAASVAPVGKIAIRHVRELAGKAEASIIGGGMKTSAPEAAFANAFMARCLEYDDCWLPMGHPSSTIVPTSLAMAESLSLPGRVMLESYILGVETATKIALACGDILSTGRTLSIYSVMGNAAAASRCLGLDAEKTTIAFGIAAAAAAGLLQRSNMILSFQQGIAARNGIVAALLAKDGFTAAEDILERPMGFAQVFRGEHAQGFGKTIESLGKPFHVVSPGVGVRKYPFVYFFQGVVDAVLELLTEKNILYEDIKEVRVPVTPRQVEMFGMAKPQSVYEAKFNLPYILGTAIYKQKVDLESFSDEAIRDPRRLEAIGKVKLDTLKEAQIPTDAPQQYFNPPVNIKLQDGREFSHRVDPPRGDWRDPKPKQEVVLPKFKRLSRLVLSEKNTQKVIDLVGELEELDSLSELVGLLRM
ncbi:MmgE/PrpD family protein [Chloroflexota bacterium]